MHFNAKFWGYCSNQKSRRTKLPEKPISFYFFRLSKTAFSDYTDSSSSTNFSVDKLLGSTAKSKTNLVSFFEKVFRQTKPIKKLDSIKISKFEPFSLIFFIKTWTDRQHFSHIFCGWKKTTVLSLLQNLLEKSVTNKGAFNSNFSGLIHLSEVPGDRKFQTLQSTSIPFFWFSKLNVSNTTTVSCKNCQAVKKSSILMRRISV